MKRIMWITISFITLIFLTSSAFALEDLSPSYDISDSTPNSQASFDPVCSQNAARISRIDTKIDLLQDGIDSSFKKSDIPELEQGINDDIAEQLNEFIGRMLLLLIIYTVFFFSLLFLAKAKGYT